MNYQAIYDHLIQKNRNTPKVKKQTNDHHIIPRSFAKIDGIEDIDGQWNRVNLPLREHFIAHLLLARIWRHDKQKGRAMAFAFRRMSNCGRYTSRNYHWLRLNYSHSTNTRRKISDKNKGQPGPNKGRTFTDDWKTKLSMAKQGKKRKQFTKETREKMSNRAKTRIVSEETKRKISETKTNKTYTKEVREQRQAKTDQMPRHECPYCQRTIIYYQFSKHLSCCPKGHNQ